MIRILRPDRRPRASRSATAVVGLLALAAALACNPGDEEDELLITLPASPNSGFVADEAPGCPRGDLLSLQEDRTVGSLVSVDIVLTDCDGSLQVSGVAFEIAFDPSAVEFLSCDPGDLLPPAQLIPGTPACTISGGNLLGTIAIGSQQSVRVGGSGSAIVVSVNFNLRGASVNSPVAFVNTDNLSSTGVWVTDPGTSAANIQNLGPAGYAGGRFLSN